MLGRIKTPGQREREAKAEDAARIKRKRYWRWRTWTREQLMDRIIELEAFSNKTDVSRAAFMKENLELKQENQKLKAQLRGD